MTNRQIFYFSMLEITKLFSMKPDPMRLAQTLKVGRLIEKDKTTTVYYINRPRKKLEDDHQVLGTGEHIRDANYLDLELLNIRWIICGKPTKLSPKKFSLWNPFGVYLYEFVQAPPENIDFPLPSRGS